MEGGRWGVTADDTGYRSKRAEGDERNGVNGDGLRADQRRQLTHDRFKMYRLH